MLYLVEALNSVSGDLNLISLIFSPWNVFAFSNDVAQIWLQALFDSYIPSSGIKWYLKNPLSQEEKNVTCPEKHIRALILRYSKASCEIRKSKCSPKIYYPFVSMQNLQLVWSTTLNLKVFRPDSKAQCYWGHLLKVTLNYFWSSGRIC